MRMRPLQMMLVLAAMIGAMASRASAMTFEAIDNPAECGPQACVLATGAIDDHTSDDFRAFITQNRLPAGALVILDSDGGQVLQSMRLGNVIRQARLATRVAAYDRRKGGFRAGGRCAGECAYAFLGGVERSLGERARIGVHQVETSTGAAALSAADAQWLTSMIATHVHHLCGSVGLLVSVMAAGPSDVHWLSPDELLRDGVITARPA